MVSGQKIIHLLVSFEVHRLLGVFKLNLTNLFKGAIGDILGDRADIAFNSRFIIDYDTKNIDFIYPVFSDRFCIIVPSALKIPGWKAIFRCFHYSVWILILVVDLVCALFWYFLKRTTMIKTLMFRSRSTLHKIPSVTNVTLDMLLLMTSSPIVIPHRTKERMFIGSCLIANIVIVGTFQVRALIIAN